MMMQTQTEALHGEHDEHEHDEPHVLPIGVYLAVWGALVVLTAITVTVAHFDFGQWNTVVAMVIATIKGSLVALYFMHLRYDNKLNLLILLGSLMLVSIFFYPTLTDLISRGYTDPVKFEEINVPVPASMPAPGAPLPAEGGEHH